MHNFNTSKEACALGGSTANTKLYMCPNCNHMDTGNLFVHRHLIGICRGPGKKLQAKQKKFVGREAEAMLNTAVWNAEQMIKEEYQNYLDLKFRVEADIERMKEIGDEFTWQKNPIF